MKLLFITYDFYPNFGANSYIIYNLSQAFIKMGHEVHILSLKASPGYEKDEIWNQIYIHRVTNSYDKNQVQKYLHSFQLLSALRLSASIVRDRYNQKEFLKKHWSYYSVKSLSIILEENEIDTVVNVCYPFESCLPIMQYMKKKKKKKAFQWIIYMQDPFATNYYYLEKYSKTDLLNFQTKAFQKADYIIGTASIVNELEAEEDSKISFQKFKILNFPIVTKLYRTRMNGDIIFNRHYVNCVYVGKLNKDTRNPEKLFQIYGKLKKDRIRLHIIGEEKEQWETLLPEDSSNIFFHGIKSKEIVTNAELNANILINIGNSVSNQLPSKLLEYISTGKPIVNLYKVEDCPTLEYIKRYPYGFNILESKIDQTTLKKLRHFCIRRRNVQIQYNKIEKRFYDCTVDYVSSEFLKLCKELVNNNQLIN